jgi:DMSO reductase anchor subunit
LGVDGFEEGFAVVGEQGLVAAHAGALAASEHVGNDLRAVHRLMLAPAGKGRASKQTRACTR